MEKKVIISIPVSLFRFFLILFLLLLCASCSKKQNIQFTYLKGRLAWNRQDWNTAVIHFSLAEEQAKQLDPDNMAHEQYSHYTAFALASSYLVQNEEKAAAQKIASIPQTADKRLMAIKYYQQGIIAFRAKNYSEAARFFKQSLERADTDFDAKKNYELCKRLCHYQEEIQQKPLAPTNTQEESPSEHTIVLEIAQKKEDSKWHTPQQDNIPAINDF